MALYNWNKCIRDQQESNRKQQGNYRKEKTKEKNRTWRSAALFWPFNLTTPWKAMLLGIWYAQGSRDCKWKITAFKTCPRCHWKKKKIKTRQAFNWPISRGKFNSHPLKESYEKMSTSLNIRDMQIKTTMRYFLTWFTMTIVPKLTENKCWRKCGKREPSHTVGEKVK